jgi:hypothetical protein
MCTTISLRDINSLFWIFHLDILYMLNKKQLNYNNRGTLGNSVFYSVRAKGLQKKDTSQTTVEWTRPSAWGYNRATLFLGDINTGTWSQI